MRIRTNHSTGTEFPAHTVKVNATLPAPAKNVRTLVRYQGIRSRSWAKAPLTKFSEKGSYFFREHDRKF